MPPRRKNVGKGLSPAARKKKQSRSKERRPDNRNSENLPPPKRVRASRPESSASPSAPEVLSEVGRAHGPSYSQSPQHTTPVRRSPRRGSNVDASPPAGGFLRRSPKGAHSGTAGKNVRTGTSRSTVSLRHVEESIAWREEGVRGNRDIDGEDGGSNDEGVDTPAGCIPSGRKKNVRALPALEARLPPPAPGGRRSFGMSSGRSLQSRIPAGEQATPVNQAIPPSAPSGGHAPNFFEAGRDEGVVDVVGSSVRIRNSPPAIAELSEHQRGVITATKKLLGKTERQVVGRVEQVGAEVKAVLALLRDQKKDMDKLKEFTNMLIYAVGGKGKDVTPVLTVVRAGVEKMFSAAYFIPFLRNAFVMWAVEDILEAGSEVARIGMAALREKSVDVLRSVFIVRPSGGKRSDRLIASKWARRNQALRGVTVRAMIIYAMSDRNAENLLKLPGCTAEESKPAWLRNLRDNHVDAVLQSIEKGTDEPRGAKKSAGNVISPKEISEAVVHEVHSVVVAFLNRSRERMRTTFFTTCSFLFHKHVKVLLCDGDVRSNSRDILSIPLAKTGSDISTCGQEVEENEDAWNSLKRECAFMSFLVDYEVHVSDNSTSPNDAERKVVHRIISALGVGLELCLSLTQCSCAEEFFLISEHSLRMVFMIATVVREIMIEKVTDITCVLAEEDRDVGWWLTQDDVPSEVSIMELCTLMQPPTSSSRNRMLQKHILSISSEKYEALNRTEGNDTDGEHGGPDDDDNSGDDAAVCDEELEDLINE